MINRKIIIPVILFLIVACNQESKTESEIPVIKVETTTVGMKSVKIPVNVSGKIKSSKESRLAFKIPGIIKKINVKEGDLVREGTVLASLDLTEIEAGLNKARTAVEKAERDYARVEKLYRDSVATLEQFQDISSAREIALADLNSAGFNYKHALISAPSAGKILKRRYEEHELINAGEPVFLFAADSDDLTMETAVADVDVVKIKPGDEAIVFPDAYPSEKINGTVNEISRVEDPYTGLYEVTISLKRSKLNLFSGFSSRAEIIPANENPEIVIPVESLVEADERKAYVFIVEDKQKVKKHRVIIKNILNEKIVLEKNSLQPGQEIVTRGVEYLRDGYSVKITGENQN